MAQMAMQQQMPEICEHLEAINAKVDDVPQAQKDPVLSDMVGVDLVIEIRRPRPRRRALPDPLSRGIRAAASS